MELSTQSSHMLPNICDAWPRTIANNVASCDADGNVQNGGIDLFHATPDELTMELSRRVSKRVDDILKGGADADPIRLGSPGHRARLYEIRFKATAGGPLVCITS